MAGGIIQDLVFRIASNTAELSKGLAEAKSKINAFSQGLNQMKSLITGAFTVTAIIGAGKALFDLATGLDDVIGKVDDLGSSMNLIADSAQLKAIADTFNVDIDKVLSAANSTAKNFGLSFSDSLKMVQDGLALAGPQSEKFLKSIEANGDKFATAGGNAEQYFSLVTDGYRTSTDWEKEVEKGAKASTMAWTDLVAQKNEDQIIQGQLVNSTKALNEELMNLFDGTNSKVDQLNILWKDSLLGTILATKKAVDEVANSFKTLYNNFGLLRVVLELIRVNFVAVWEIAKGFVMSLTKGLMTLLNLLGPFLKALATIPDIIGALQTGNFELAGLMIKKRYSDIASVIKEGLTEQGKIFEDAGKSIWDSLKKGVYNGAVGGFDVINEDAVNDEADKAGTGAGQSFKKAFEAKTKAIKITMPEYGEEGGKEAGLKDYTGPDMSNAASGIFGDATPLADVNTAMADAVMKAREANKEITSLGDTFQKQIGGVAVDAFGDLGAAITDTSKTGKEKQRELVISVLQGIARMIQAYLAQAIAASIAANAGIPGIGLVLAAAGVAAVSAMFGKIPAFADGGFSSGGMALVGERGAELVNLPRGAQVHSNSNSMRMLDNAATKIEVVVRGVVEGEKLRLVLDEANRRRV